MTFCMSPLISQHLFWWNPSCLPADWVQAWIVLVPNAPNSTKDFSRPDMILICPTFPWKTQEMSTSVLLLHINLWQPPAFPVLKEIDLTLAGGSNFNSTCSVFQHLQGRRLPNAWLSTPQNDIPPKCCFNATDLVLFFCFLFPVCFSADKLSPNLRESDATALKDQQSWQSNRAQLFQENLLETRLRWQG